MQAQFITFEGLDGSGKSTHLRRAVRWLEERDLRFELTHEPGGTPLGEGIRSLFLDHRWEAMDGQVEALLVFASRRQHLLEVIEPALAAGRHVFCDRFTDSTNAYQGYGRDLPLDWIRELDRLATGCRQPDHTLVFDLPPEAARRRGHSKNRRRKPGGPDRIDAETLTFYRRVRDGYKELHRQQPERLHLVDSAGSKNGTWMQVAAILCRILEQD